jgi:glycosyltransferase involved in cell wall biosynthesis
MSNNRKHIITSIFPDKLGGVYILMKNLTEFFPNPDYRFYTILTNLKEDQYPIPESHFPKQSCTKFSFSKFDNRYNIYKRLRKCIHPDSSIVIANDWLELEMLTATKYKGKLIFILHGDYPYYYELAQKYAGIIDKFIAVSNFIAEKLKGLLPERESDILYLKNIISPPPPKTSNIRNKTLSAIFVGRLSEEKGYFDLEKIDNLLHSQNILINWTIIGNKLYDEERYSWLNKANVKCLGPLCNSKTLAEYHKHDLFILPTKAEGLGMVIIEAMKAGCIPLVSKLDAGIPEFVIQNKTGFMIPVGDIEEYCNIIIKLHKIPLLIEELSKNAIEKADELFNPVRDSSEYYQLFEGMAAVPAKNKVYPKLMLSKLDKPGLPNWLVKFFRLIINKCKS